MRKSLARLVVTLLLFVAASAHADAVYCWFLRQASSRTAYLSAIHENPAESPASFKRRFAGYLMTKYGRSISLDSVTCTYDEGGSVRNQSSLLEQELGREGYQAVVHTLYLGRESADAGRASGGVGKFRVPPSLQLHKRTSASGRLLPYSS